jgi:hypothetical protein
MDHLAAKLEHAPQRRLDIFHLEIWEGMRVAGSCAPLMHAQRRGAVRGLPTLALVARTIDELDAQDSVPKASGAIGIVGRELDQVQWRVHGHTIRCP